MADEQILADADSLKTWVEDDEPWGNIHGADIDEIKASIRRVSAYILSPAPIVSGEMVLVPREGLVGIVGHLFDKLGMVDPDWEGFDAEVETFVTAMLAASTPASTEIAGVIVDGPNGPEFHVPRVAKPNLAALGLDDPESRN